MYGWKTSFLSGWLPGRCYVSFHIIAHCSSPFRGKHPFLSQYHSFFSQSQDLWICGGKHHDCQWLPRYRERFLVNTGGGFVKMMGLRRSNLVTFRRIAILGQDIQVKPFQLNETSWLSPCEWFGIRNAPLRKISHPSPGMEATGYSRDTGGVVPVNRKPRMDGWMDRCSHQKPTDPPGKNQWKNILRVYFWWVWGPGTGVGPNFFYVFCFLPLKGCLPLLWCRHEIFRISSNFCVWKSLTNHLCLPLRNLGSFLFPSKFQDLMEADMPRVEDRRYQTRFVCTCPWYFCSFSDAFSFAWRSHKTLNNQTSLHLERMFGLIFSTRTNLWVGSSHPGSAVPLHSGGRWI